MTVLLLALLTPAAALCEEAAEDSQQTRKAVYLTFDDGPKQDTPELLALLEEQGVPATFFFVGQKVRTFPEEAKMVYESGHAIGCHSMFHSYSNLKKSTSNVEADFNRFIAVMREYVDEDFDTDLYRFPGGSTSYSYKAKVTVRDMGCAWFDWSAMTGDTLPNMRAQDLYDYVIRTARGEEVVIVLAHEGKTRTRQILPDLIAYFREQGFEFRALSTSEEDRALLERCPANKMLPDVSRLDAQFAEQTE